MLLGLKICCSAYYQLRQLRVVRKSLSTKACEALVHAFVSSRLDYCNCLLYGIADKQLDFLQSVLRSAARLVLRKRKFDSISSDMRGKLHWLPVKQRIEYKICMQWRQLGGGGGGWGGRCPPPQDSPNFFLLVSLIQCSIYVHAYQALVYFST